MLRVKEKLGNIFVKDKFDAEFKNALKRHNYSITSKINDTLYDISSGTASFRIDIKDLKRQYEITHTDEELEKCIAKLEFQCVTESKMISFTNGQSMLRFLIMRDDEISQDYIYLDFIHGLKKVLVYTPDDVTISILDSSYVKRWGMPREVLFSVADRNMCRLLEKAEINEAHLCDNAKVLEFKLPCKELSVSIIMCNEFRKAVYKKLGAKFLVVIPSRENLLVLENVTNNILEGLGTVILKEYNDAKHPLTTDVLLYTPNDIQIAGRFSLGQQNLRGAIE